MIKTLTTTPENQTAGNRARGFFDPEATGCALVSADGRILRASASLAEMLGCQVGELLGRELPGGGGGEAASLRDVEAPATLPGEPRGLRLSVYELEGDLPHPRLRLAVFRDARGRQGLERELLQLDRLASLGGLVAGLSHELATPLTIIANAAETALDIGVSDAATRACLRDVRDEAFRLGDLLRGLLRFARAAPPSLKVVDLAAAAGEVVRMLRYHSARGDVRLVLNAEPGALFVLGSEALLKQVLFNLIKNACDASQEGGEVAVSVRRMGAQAACRGAVECEVADRGPGVPAADLARVFEPFYSTKPDDEGSGLGLVLARDIAEGHGGSLALEPRPGGGTLARVLLPAFAGVEGLGPDERSTAYATDHVEGDG